MDRPLNVSPEVWAKMENMQTRRGSAVQMDRLAVPKEREDVEIDDSRLDPLVVVDMAVDGLVANTKRLAGAIAAAKKAGGLNREEVMALDAIQDLLDTAIDPYLADIIKEMDVFEGVE